MGNEIYRLKPKAKRWEKVEITMQEPRNFHSVVKDKPRKISCSSGIGVLIFNE